MLLIESILGSRVDPALGERLHRLSHDGHVDTLFVAASELARRRFVGMTQHGTQVAIALPRDQKLFNGAVLLLGDDHALVVRVDRERWLAVEPRSTESALEVGYHAGNLHWRVRFEGTRLLVALEGPTQDYLARLAAFIDDGRVTTTVLEPPASPA